jgi:hypothetical protein
MNNVKRTLIILFSMAALSAFAEVPLLLVNISGTVEIQHTLSPDDSRTQSSMLNNKRVFEEFQVAPADYVLVIDANGAGTVKLVPKSAASGLPSIDVFSLNDNTPVIDTKKGFGDIFSTLSSTATGNLFEGLKGSVIGRVSFVPPISNGQLKKFAFSGVAVGKNTNGDPETTALIKLKVTTTHAFEQAP